MGNLGDLSPGGSIAIGILVGLLSTSVQSLGLTLQRKSHLLEDDKAPCDPQRPPHRRRRWQLGMAMFVISNLVGSTIQITTLPLPVLSTLQASGLVFNSICATLILGEPFTRWSFGGTLLISSGAGLIATFGAISEPAHSLDQLLSLLSRRAFVTWMLLQTTMVIAIIAFAEFLSRLAKASSSPLLHLCQGLAYGVISGILSAHSLLVAKSAVELLVHTISDRSNQFNRWQSWIIILGLIFLALTQLYYLHRGLKLVSTSILYPIVFCIYNIIAILDGLIYFKQTDRLSLVHAGLIALGTVILLSGVLALSWRLSDDQVKPTVAKSALAPGLGFVEDSDSNDSQDSAENESDQCNIGAEDQPLLSASAAKTSHGNLDLLKGFPIHGKRNGRRSEVEEIWSELEDVDILSPSNAIPRKIFPLTAATDPSIPRQSNSDIKRKSSSGFPDHNQPRPSNVDTKRRLSLGFPNITFRHSSNTAPNRRQQSALGGFWKMRWLGLKSPSDEESKLNGVVTKQSITGNVNNNTSDNAT